MGIVLSRTHIMPGEGEQGGACGKGAAARQEGRSGKDLNFLLSNHRDEQVPFGTFPLMMMAGRSV